MDKRKRSPWKLPKAFHVDIVHEIKGQHAPVAPHRKVPEGWGAPAAAAAEPAAQQGAPQPPRGAPLEFATQGLRGSLEAVRGDGVLVVALPFGRAYMQLAALAPGQTLRFKGGIAGVLEAVRADGFLVTALPFGRGFFHASALAV